MAEPAAVLSIISELATTANFCFQIIKRACNAPDEIKRLNAEISNWRPQLEVRPKPPWGCAQDGMISADIYERALQNS